MPHPVLSVLARISLSMLSIVGLASARAGPQSVTPAAVPADDALGRTIVKLYGRDQALLADLAKARKDPAFDRKFRAYRAQLATQPKFRNFGDPALYALWARDPAAPAIVRRAVEFREETDARLRAVVGGRGWPQRRMVGDEAAAGFFFLFGHADDDNAWRLTQLTTIARVFREDHVTARLYAHLRDRLADVAGKPQIYGSIMGPDKTLGTAKLYAPLVDDVAAANARRAAIGLPDIETDLATFCAGADIGPYMMPMSKGMGWTLTDVYSGPAHGPARASSKQQSGSLDRSDKTASGSQSRSGSAPSAARDAVR